MDEIPFNNTYYTGLTTPQQAVESELGRHVNHKLEDFVTLLESTPPDKLTFREVIEVVEQCPCDDPRGGYCECPHQIDQHNENTGQCMVYEPRRPDA